MTSMIFEVIGGTSSGVVSVCVYGANVVDATLWEESARRGMPNGAGPQPGGEHGDGDDVVGRWRSTPDGADAGDCRLRPDDHLSLRLLA